jgi:hypothetical protein
MILSKFALWGVMIVKMFAAVENIEDLLNGKSVYIEKGHYLLHNEIKISNILEGIEGRRCLIRELEAKNFTIPLVEELRKSGISRLKLATNSNKEQVLMILSKGNNRCQTARAIELLGDLIHVIAGNPTAAQWRSNVKLINHLKDAIQGQSDLNKAFITSIKKEESRLLQVDGKMLQLATANDMIRSELSGYGQIA